MAELRNSTIIITQPISHYCFIPRCHMPSVQISLNCAISILLHVRGEVLPSRIYLGLSSLCVCVQPSTSNQSTFRVCVIQVSIRHSPSTRKLEKRSVHDRRPRSKR